MASSFNFDAHGMGPRARSLGNLEQSLPPREVDAQRRWPSFEALSVDAPDEPPPDASSSLLGASRSRRRRPSPSPTTKGSTASLSYGLLLGSDTSANQTHERQPGEQGDHQRASSTSTHGGETVESALRAVWTSVRGLFVETHPPAVTTAPDARSRAFTFGLFPAGRDAGESEESARRRRTRREQRSGSRSRAFARRPKGPRARSPTTTTTTQPTDKAMVLEHQNDDDDDDGKLSRSSSPTRRRRGKQQQPFSLFSRKQQKDPSKKQRAQKVSDRRMLLRDAYDHQSNGRWNIKRVGGYWVSMYLDDWFNTIVHLPFLRLVLIMAMFYIAVVSVFATAYLRFSDKCGMDFNDTLEAYYFSLETMATIGYGTSDYFFGHCWEPLVLINCQITVSLIVESLYFGIIFHRLTRGRKRTNTVLFSDKAVVRRVHDAYYLIFQVCEMRRHHLLDAKIRVFAVRHERDAFGSTFFQAHRLPLRRPNDAAGGMLLMALPQLVVHRLDVHSPLVPPTTWMSESGPRLWAGLDYCVSSSASVSGDHFVPQHTTVTTDLLKFGGGTPAPPPPPPTTSSSSSFAAKMTGHRRGRSDESPRASNAKTVVSPFAAAAARGTTSAGITTASSHVAFAQRGFSPPPRPESVINNPQSSQQQPSRSDKYNSGGSSASDARLATDLVAPASRGLAPSSLAARSVDNPANKKRKQCDGLYDARVGEALQNAEVMSSPEPSPQNSVRGLLDGDNTDQASTTTAADLFDEQNPADPVAKQADLLKRNMTHFFKDREIEIIAIVEGNDEYTSRLVQARHSYTLHDLAWWRNFNPCVFRQTDGSCLIDFSEFHRTTSSHHANKGGPFVSSTHTAASSTR